MNILDFVSSFCEKANIKFLVVNDTKIKYPGSDIYCSGYFTVKEGTPVLGISQGDNFEKILCHEFSHLQQWLENSPHWTNAYLTLEEKNQLNISNLEVFEAIDLWIEQKLELSNELLVSFINRSIAVELDCELRTLELAPKLIKNFDSISYIKNANCYLRFYKYVENNRRWYLPGNPPYNDPLVVEAQLDHMNQDYFSKLSEQEEKVYNEYFTRNNDSGK
jgi:hypothetical protein